MNEFLRKRIERKLEALPDERVYQVLDYIEFLESKYATKNPGEASPLQKLAETVEDTLRAGRVSATAIKGTMDVVSAAGRVVDGLAAAGKAVVEGALPEESKGDTRPGDSGRPAPPSTPERTPDAPPKGP